MDMSTLSLAQRRLRRSLIRRCTRLRLLGAGMGEDALDSTTIVDDSSESSHGPPPCPQMAESDAHSSHASPAESLASAPTQTESLPPADSLVSGPTQTESNASPFDAPLLTHGSPLPLSWRFGEEEYASDSSPDPKAEMSVFDVTFLADPLDNSALSEGASFGRDTSLASHSPPREDISLCLSANSSPLSPEHDSWPLSPAQASAISPPSPQHTPSQPSHESVTASPETTQESTHPQPSLESGEGSDDDAETDECPFCGCNKAHTKVKGQFTLTQLFSR